MYSVSTTDPVGISLAFTLSPAADIADDLPAHLQETCFGSGLTTMYSALLSPVPVTVLSVRSVPASLSPRQMGVASRAANRILSQRTIFNRGRMLRTERWQFDLTRGQLEETPYRSRVFL